MSNNPRNKSRSKLQQEVQPVAEDDAPLEIERDQDDEAPGYATTRPQLGPAMERGAHRVVNRANETMQDDDQDLGLDQVDEDEVFTGNHNAETAIELRPPVMIDRALMGDEAGHMSDILNWALDSIHEPAVAAADWLARDIDPDQPTATALLSDPTITLAMVKQAKSVFKTMRIVGEKSADRRIGARMYAAAIAAGLVRHRTLVSRQSGEALVRGFQGLLDDHRMPSQLRDLAGMALCVLKEKRFRVDAQEGAAPRATRKPPRPQPRNTGRSAGGKSSGGKSRRR